jgi:hypothetical protein
VALRNLVARLRPQQLRKLVLVGPPCGAFAILVGREWRFRLATQGWAIALVGWVLAWMGERIGPVLPPPEVTLMLPVIGLSLAIGAGLAAFERDVAGSDFGFRQVFSMVAATLMVVASVAWVARSANGRWGLPEEGNLAVVGTLTSQAPEGEYRTLWLGDADVLPMGSWTLSNGSSFATTSGLFPRIGLVRRTFVEGHRHAQGGARGRGGRQDHPPGAPAGGDGHQVRGRRPIGSAAGLRQGQGGGQAP